MGRCSIPKGGKGGMIRTSESTQVKETSAGNISCGGGQSARNANGTNQGLGQK